MDLGDRKHSVCVLDAAGKVVHRARIANDHTELRALAEQWKEALFVMEVGAHSPWISRFMEGLGCRVIVANARKVRAIYQSERKDDDRDAEQPARIARVDESLLYPVQHGTEQEQRDLLAIKLRDALVSSRALLLGRPLCSLIEFATQGHAERGDRWKRATRQQSELASDCSRQGEGDGI